MQPSDVVDCACHLLSYVRRQKTMDENIISEINDVKDNKHAMLEFRRLRAMMKAYGILPDEYESMPVNYFTRALFIGENHVFSDAHRQKIKLLIELTKCPYDLVEDFDCMMSRQYFFSNMFCYKNELEKFDDPSRFDIYSLRQGSRASTMRLIRDLYRANIYPLLAVVNDVLAGFIADESHTISVDELIEKYDYPDDYHLREGATIEDVLARL